MHMREGIGSPQFCRRITQHTFHRRTGVKEIPFPTQNAKDIEGVFRKGAKIFLAADQFRLHLPPFGAFTGLLRGPADRRGQPLRIMFEHVIGRTRLETLNRGMLADGARNENERQVGVFFANKSQRLQARDIGAAGNPTK